MPSPPPSHLPTITGSALLLYTTRTCQPRSQRVHFASISTSTSTSTSTSITTSNSSSKIADTTSIPVHGEPLLTPPSDASTTSSSASSLVPTQELTPGLTPESTISDTDADTDVQEREQKIEYKLGQKRESEKKREREKEKEKERERIEHLRRRKAQAEKHLSAARKAIEKTPWRLRGPERTPPLPACASTISTITSSPSSQSQNMITDGASEASDSEPTSEPGARLSIAKQNPENERESASDKKAQMGDRTVGRTDDTTGNRVDEAADAGAVNYTWLELCRDRGFTTWHTALAEQLEHWRRHYGWTVAAGSYSGTGTDSGDFEAWLDATAVLRAFGKRLLDEECTAGVEGVRSRDEETGRRRVAEGTLVKGSKKKEEAGEEEEEEEGTGGVICSPALEVLLNDAAAAGKKMRERGIKLAR